MFVLDCILLIGTCQGMEDLLRDGESDDLVLRADGYHAILDRWREWSDDDLALLQGTSRSEDPEPSGRAGEVLRRILLRRKIEPSGLLEEEEAERIIVQGSEGDRLHLLQKNSGRPREFSLLVQLGVEFEWQFSEESAGPLLRFDGAWPLAVGLFSDPSEQVRLQALSALGATLAKGKSPILGRLLLDPGASVRRKAMDFIRGEAAATVLPQLYALLDDEAGGIRAYALETLVASGFPPAAGEILSRLPEPDPEARATKIEALGGRGDRRLAALVASYLSDPVPRVRCSAVFSLAALLGEEATSSLRPLLDDEDDGVRLAVLQALREGKTGEEIGVALRFLRETWENVGCTASLILYERDPELLRTLVVSWLGEEDPKLRGTAQAIACRYPEILREADLERTLSDPEPGLRLVAFRTLMSREAAEGYWDAMLPLLSDPVQEMKSEAIQYFLSTPLAETLFARSGSYHDVLEDRSGTAWPCRIRIVQAVGLWDEIVSLLPGIEEQCLDAWAEVENALVGAANAGAWDVLVASVYAEDGRVARVALRALERSLDLRGEDELSLLVGFPEVPIALRGLDLVREEDRGRRRACLASLLGTGYPPVEKAARRLLARDMAFLAEEALYAEATP